MTLGQNVPKLDALHLMDGIEGLRSLPKHSVDMLLTDPPYGTTRNFWAVGGGSLGGEAQRSHPVFCSMPL